MSNIPAYLYPCVAPDTTSNNSVYVLGVPSSTEGRLEAYKVNLSNVNAPTAIFAGDSTEIGIWSSQAPKYCNNFPWDSAGSPVMLQQFGPRSRTTLMYPNGTFQFSSYFPNIAYMSPKLYSLNAANGNFNWFTAFTNLTNDWNGSRWAGLRLNDTAFLTGQYE